MDDMMQQMESAMEEEEESRMAKMQKRCARYSKTL